MKSNSKLFYLTAACLVLLRAGMTGQQSNSQDIDSTVELEPVVVKDDQKETIALDDDVTAIQLDRRDATDLADTFRLSPSVVVNGGRSQAQQIFVNNLESTLLNVTIDGAPQGNLYHHQSSVLVDPELLKRVDVVAGSGSALDGPGALGGAIRFETKNAFDLLEEGQRFGGRPKATYYSNGEGYRVSQSIYGLLDQNTGALFSISRTDRDAYEDGDGNVVDNTDFERLSTLLKLSGRYKNGHSVDFGYEFFEDEIMAYDRVNISLGFLQSTGRPTGPLQPLSATRNTVTLKHGYNPESNPWINTQTRVFYTLQDFEREQSREIAKLGNVGIDARNTSTFDDVGIFDELKSTYGLDFQDKRSESTYAFVPLDGKEQESVFGAYWQNALNKGIATLHFGLRFDSYDYTDVSDQDFDSTELSPNVGLTLEPVEHLTIGANYNESYRGVGTREVFLVSARPAGLDGEDARYYRAFMTYDDEKYFVSGSVFQQHIDDFLYPIASGGNGSFGDVKSWGYDGRLGTRWKGVTAAVGMSYADPEVEGYAYPDDIGMVVAGRFWVADVRYTHQSSGISAGWTMQYREGVDEVPLGRFPAVAGKSPYALHHLQLVWNSKQVEGLQLALNVNNIFDRTYQDHTIYTASGLNSPGREFRISAGYSF